MTQAGRRASLLLALVTWFSFVLGAATSFATQDIEYQVKAAFIYNFAKFVVWPDSAFSSEDEALTICVLGSPTLLNVLQRSVVGRTTQGKSVSLQHVVGNTAPPTCRILFVDASVDASVARILRNLGNRAILTVGESKAFATGGGMIRLVTESGKIRFDINARAAKHVGLRLRSQLLTLARHVER